MPVPSVSMIALRAPRASPQRHSASIAALPSLSTATGRPRRSASTSRTATPCSGRWLESSATPVAGSTRQGIPSPTASTSRGRRLARLLDRLDELVDERPGVVGTRQAIGAVMHLELRVDRPGEQLRPSQVDADDAAGGHDRPPYLADGGPPGASRVQGLPHASAPSAARRRRRIDARRAARRAARASAGASRSRVGRVVKWLVARAGRAGSASRSSSSSSPRRSTRTRCPPPRRPSCPAAASGSSSRRRPSSSAPTSARRGPRSPARARRAPAAATRSCSCAPAAATAPSCRSRATPSSTSPATGATRSTPPTRSAAPRSRSQTIKQYLGITIDHVFEVNFDNFPDLVDAMGGIDYTGGCVVSRINGGFKNGGFTLRLPAGRRTSTASRRSRSPARATTRATPRGRPHPRAPPAEGHQRDEVARVQPGRLHPPALHLVERAQDAEDRHARPGAAGLRDRHGAERQRADRGPQALGRRDPARRRRRPRPSRTPRSRPTSGASATGSARAPRA